MLLKHTRHFLLRGILASIPLFLVYLVIRFLYVTLDRNVVGLIDQFVGFTFPGLGFIITLILLYLLGLFSSNLFGRWVFSKFEKLTDKIPLIGTVYRVGKQISGSFALPEGQVFKRVVLLNYLNENMYTVGFVTGTVTDKATGQKFIRVFVPTPPNPTTGTIIIAREEDVIDPGWSIEAGFQTVISAGIIGPGEFHFKKSGSKKNTEITEKLTTETTEKT